jgi:hypothetical protein
MATAARRLQWLLLVISFSAVLRPTWTGHLDWTDHEGMRTGFCQPDGANGASSVRGVNFPVWCLLVHFGSIEKRAGRSAIRRMRLAGVHQPARHLLHSHGMSTMHTPLETLFTTFCEQTSTAEPRVFLGVGLYFLLLLLACHDVERHPGPWSRLEQLHLEIVVKGPASEYSTAELFTYISELLNNAIKQSEKIGALKKENVNLSSRVCELEKRVSSLEKEQRRKNVVVFGVSTETDLKKAIDDVILKKLSSKKPPKQEDVIEKAYRFGRDAPQRPILIRFKNESDKVRALKLAPTQRGSKITISEDLTTEERQARRKIVDAHKAARAENIESKVLRQGLLVEGEIVPLNELEKSDWLEKLLHKNDNSTLAKTFENSPVKPTLSGKDCPKAPKKSTAMVRNRSDLK